MGANSTDALKTFMLEFLKDCRVVGDRVVYEPGEQVQDQPSALPRYAAGEHCLFCGAPGGHGGLQCPELASVPGRPDWKRGQ